MIVILLVSGNVSNPRAHDFLAKHKPNTVEISSGGIYSISLHLRISNGSIAQSIQLSLTVAQKQSRANPNNLRSPSRVNRTHVFLLKGCGVFATMYNTLLSYTCQEGKNTKPLAGVSCKGHTSEMTSQFFDRYVLDPRSWVWSRGYLMAISFRH